MLQAKDKYRNLSSVDSFVITIRGTFPVIEGTFTMKTFPALLLTGAFTDTSVGQTYNKTLTISGEAEPYTFSHTGKIP